MPRRRDPWDIPAPDLRASVCECGIDIPPKGVLPTELWVTRHKVHHLDWSGNPHLGELATSLRALVHALEADGKKLRDDIADRDDRIEDLEAELTPSTGVSGEGALPAGPSGGDDPTDPVSAPT